MSLCSLCNHSQSKHAFDIVANNKINPCALSCMICYDLETKKLEKEKIKNG